MPAMQRKQGYSGKEGAREVHIEKRMQQGQQITFKGQADEAPDTFPPTHLDDRKLLIKSNPGEAIKPDMELDECEETTVHDVKMEEELRREEQQHLRRHEAYDVDDDDEPSMPRVQCAQQIITTQIQQGTQDQIDKAKSYMVKRISGRRRFRKQERTAHPYRQHLLPGERRGIAEQKGEGIAQEEKTGKERGKGLFS
ncbi:putative Chaperone protein dnaJ [Corchorus olitorius]|uniref:Chaperone protein dnaJ n=1 Tax=Corchorus olitorius TaxID=93759 RepID=A0A1R3GND1_9ROSI|nr:putative Chaperone protein dnaJ [Corchorus olitorius]